MRVMNTSLLASVAIALFLPTAAQAQYFYEGPQKPEVEIDLSVLNDPSQSPTPPAPAYAAPPQPAYGYDAGASEYPAPITTAVPPVQVEQAPLPPTVSPYENSRVVDRVELESGNPYAAPAAPSPFSPPALIKPPKPRTETPRTVPATVFKPVPAAPYDGGAPVVVEAEPEQGVEMPAIVVTQDVVESKKRTAGNKPRIVVQKPVRKPAVLSLASEPAPVTEAEADTTPKPVEEAPAPVVAELSPLEQVAEPAVVVPEPPVTVVETTTAEAAPPEMDAAPVVTAPPMPAIPEVAETKNEQPPPEMKKTAEAVIDDLYTLPTVAETAPPRDEGTATPANATTQAIAFQNGSAALDNAMIATIDAIADKLDDTKDSRLLIKGYASGADGDRAAARRLSVSRALAVRSHLMDKGVKPSRVDVRGLGMEGEATDTTQLDRVDLVLIP